MSGKLKILATVSVAAVGIGLLIYASIRASARQFVTVTQLQQNPEKYDGKRVKLSGEVMNDSASYNEKTLDLSFDATDLQKSTDNRVTIDYNGPKPDAFKEGGVVIVEGMFQKETNRVKAKKLQAKCPSRYKKEGYPGKKTTKKDSSPEKTSP